MWACYLFLLYILLLQRIVPTNGLKENDREAFLIIFPIVCQHCTMYMYLLYPSSLVFFNFTSLATHHYSKLSTTSTVAPR